MDISIAFRASSGRHLFSSSPALVKARLLPCQGEHYYLVRNQINLPASAGICNLLFLRAGWSNWPVTKAPTFCFFCKVFDPLSCFFPELRTVDFHVIADRNEPLRTEGLTGSQAVTNILSEIDPAPYNAAHVGTNKHPPPPAGPVARLFADPGARPFINNRFRLSFINTSHPTQAGKQEVNPA